MPDGTLRAQCQHRPRARSRRDPLAVPRRRVRRDHGGQSPGELDWPVGNQPRLSVPLHLLRLGLGHRRQGHQVRRGAALSRGRLVRREEDRIHLLLRRQFRHPEARRRHREVRRRDQAGDRLSGGAVGAEHQECHRARLRDPEDPVGCRPQQGRGALHAKRRQDDAARPSSATTSRSTPTWSCSGASRAIASRPTRT